MGGGLSVFNFCRLHSLVDVMGLAGRSGQWFFHQQLTTQAGGHLIHLASQHGRGGQSHDGQDKPFLASVVNQWKPRPRIIWHQG